jgi:F-type H+-transporting ATPase subunit b
MTIDWFTIVAEIVNFLLLVYLLRRFLYPVIIRAMDQREKLIASRLDAAEAKVQEATKAEAAFVRQQQELAASSEQLTAHAREDAEKLRLKLSEQARADVDAEKVHWQDVVRNEEDAFLQRLRVRTAEQVVVIVGRALEDMADEQLEERIVAKFLERLKNETKTEAAAIKKSLKKEKAAMLISSAFELPEDARQMVRDALKAQWGTTVEPTFATSTDLIGGIELRVGELRISWSLRSYLDELGQEISKAIEETQRSDRGTSK